MLQSNIFIDYAALTPHRDPIYGMYTLPTARNNSKYIYIYFFFGHNGLNIYGQLTRTNPDLHGL